VILTTVTFLAVVMLTCLAGIAVIPRFDRHPLESETPEVRARGGRDAR
jgi:hypothetical protein